jgi:hypothetical protein
MALFSECYVGHGFSETEHFSIMEACDQVYGTILGLHVFKNIRGFAVKFVILDSAP